MKTITATISRIKMCGGGTSYDVYVPVECKAYKPICCNEYATEIGYNGKCYLSLADFLRTREIDELEPLSDIRSSAFKRIRKLAKRLEIELAKRVYPELKNRKELPCLWASWTLPSETKEIEFRIKSNKY